MPLQLSKPSGPVGAGTPHALLRAAVRGWGPRPLFTFYDDATGERVELSVLTTDNWVAKTANLMRDELALGAGAAVRLLLPAHWQSAVWLLACWSLGAVVCQDAAADLAVATPQRLADAEGAGARVSLSLHALGAGPGERAAPSSSGVLDYAREVGAHADRFVRAAPDDPALAAWRSPGHTFTAGGLVEEAARRCAVDGLRRGARLLVERGVTNRQDARLPAPASTAPPQQNGIDLDWALAAVVAPLLLGGSTVIVRNAGYASLEARSARARAERIG